MATDSREDLKPLPCPFCPTGGNPHPHGLQIGLKTAWHVWCDNFGGCGAQGPCGETASQAIARWNRRAPQPQPGNEERAKRAARKICGHLQEAVDGTTAIILSEFADAPGAEKPATEPWPHERECPYFGMPEMGYHVGYCRCGSPVPPASAERERAFSWREWNCIAMILNESVSVDELLKAITSEEFTALREKVMRERDSCLRHKAKEGA